MSRENYLVERIDRSREAPAAKAVRTQRAMYLRMTARQTIIAMVKELEPQERAAILEDTLDMVAEQLHPIIGRVEAATAFNSRAADICGPLKLGRAIASARAEQLFTRAANEDHANDGGAK